MIASNGPLSRWNRTFTTGDGEATTISARGSPTSSGQEKLRLSRYSSRRLLGHLASRPKIGEDAGELRRHRDVCQPVGEPGVIERPA